MKAKVIETGEIVNVTPNPTWYKENGQGPDRREWDEEELEFIYSNKKEEKLDLDKLQEELDKAVEIYKPTGNFGWGTLYNIAVHFYELGLKTQKGEEV